MKVYSNEIVFRGHPDKVCDQISDALLDAYLKGDKDSRVAAETMGGKGCVFITGEVTSKATVDVEAVVKRVLDDVGYNSSEYKVVNNLGLQSPDISQGVDTGGAGDQGMMFGYACDDTVEMLPKAMIILQAFSKFYDELRQFDSRFLADGKAQITGIYNDEFRIERIKTFTISYQNTEIEREETDEILIEKAIKLCQEYNLEVDEFLINPTGKFLVGGFAGDSGLTGRKIVVDAYQSFANVGGGAYSGKDPSKVDRSGAYKAREIAMMILKKHNLKWCEVQLSYAIGIAEPLAIYIDSDRGNIEVTKELYQECKPREIINHLDLKKPIYEETARFGHYGNKFSWDE